MLNDGLSLKSAFSEACTTLDASIKDLTNVKIALLSFAALAEIDHSILGKDGEFEHVHSMLFNSCSKEYHQILVTDISIQESA